MVLMVLLMAILMMLWGRLPFRSATRAPTQARLRAALLGGSLAHSGTFVGLRGAGMAVVWTGSAIAAVATAACFEDAPSALSAVVLAPECWLLGTAVVAVPALLVATPLLLGGAACGAACGAARGALASRARLSPSSAGGGKVTAALVDVVEGACAFERALIAHRTALVRAVWLLPPVAVSCGLRPHRQAST